MKMVKTMKVIEEEDLILLGINPDKMAHVQWKKENGKNVIYIEEDDEIGCGHGNCRGNRNTKQFKSRDNVDLVMKELAGK